MPEKDCIIELHCSQEQLDSWEEIADKMCMNIYEYIRRCVDAHTNILRYDSFRLVDKD